jgi:hypothetical protein
MKIDPFLIGHTFGSGAGTGFSFYALKETELYLLLIPMSVMFFFTIADIYVVVKIIRNRKRATES